MDLIRIDPTWYLADILIEGYNSLIWTERYREPGEFELQTYKVNETKNLLPNDSLVSLRDAREVMIVESQEINADANNRKILTIRGRSLTSFLEQRIIQGISNTWKKVGKTSYYPNGTSMTNSDHILAQIWNAIVDRDYLIGTSWLQTDINMMDKTHPREDEIPHTAVSSSVGFNNLVEPINYSKSAARFTQPGYLYTRVLELLDREKLGIRCIRPLEGDTANILKVNFFKADDALDPRYAARFTVTKSVRPSADYLLFDVYNGQDRSLKIDLTDALEHLIVFGDDSVVFQYNQGHYSNAKYLITKQQYKNVGYVTTNTNDLNDYLYPDETARNAISGLKRRIQLTDVGDFQNPGDSHQDAIDALTDKSESDIKKTRRTFFLDATISPQIPYKYNEHYFLGDTVLLMGEYGNPQKMIVSEYIRTKDSQGEKGFPTLVDA